MNTILKPADENAWPIRLYPVVLVTTPMGVLQVMFNGINHVYVECDDATINGVAYSFGLHLRGEDDTAPLKPDPSGHFRLTRKDHADPSAAARRKALEVITEAAQVADKNHPLLRPAAKVGTVRAEMMDKVKERQKAQDKVFALNEEVEAIRLRLDEATAQLTAKVNA